MLSYQALKQSLEQRCAQDLTAPLLVIEQKSLGETAA
jgi:hypothetical protein